MHPWHRDLHCAHCKAWLCCDWINYEHQNVVSFGQSCSRHSLKTLKNYTLRDVADISYIHKYASFTICSFNFKNKWVNVANLARLFFKDYLPKGFTICELVSMISVFHPFQNAPSLQKFMCILLVVLPLAENCITNVEHHIVTFLYCYEH